jgi:hypothetical protein
MSAGTDAPPGEVAEAVERIEDIDQLIEKNWQLIEESMRKALDGRVRDEEKERARQGWHRRVNENLDLMRKLLNDREQIAQALEIEELKEADSP